MNHRAIVAKQLNEELVSLRARIAVVEAGILALGGNIAIEAAPKGRTRGRRAAGPASTATAASTTSRVRTRTRSNGADSPALIEQLKVISASDLTPIQKAQASRKARAAAKRGETPAPVKAEGAILGEAAAAEA